MKERRARMLGDLIDLIRHFGHEPRRNYGKWAQDTYDAADELGIDLYPVHTYVKEFGGIIAALDEAFKMIGSGHSQGYKNYLDEELLGLLVNLKWKLGKYPLIRSTGWGIDAEKVAAEKGWHLPTPVLIKRRFGSFEGAFELADEYEEKILRADKLPEVPK